MGGYYFYYVIIDKNSSFHKMLVMFVVNIFVLKLFPKTVHSLIHTI